MLEFIIIQIIKPDDLLMRLKMHVWLWSWYCISIWIIDNCSSMAEVVIIDEFIKLVEGYKCETLFHLTNRYPNSIQWIYNYEYVQLGIAFLFLYE